MAPRAKDKPDGTPAEGRQRAAHLGPERRRPLVLDAALHLFVEHGYRGTSMEGIAAAAGVTKPVVDRLTEMTEPMLSSMGVADSARKAPVLSEVVASVAEGGVRLLLSDGEDWTPEELGEFLGRLVARGPAAV